jgi:DNA topoisomerase-1
MAKKKEENVSSKSKSSSKDKKDKKRKVEESPAGDSPKKKRVKKEEEPQEHIWKWWEEEALEAGTKWRTLEHKGPLLAPEYQPLPKHVKFYYDGKPMDLSEPAEEVAGFYARMLDHEYTSMEQFNKNFFKDWRKEMTPHEREIITDLKKCDFRRIAEYYKEESEKRKAMTKEEKQKLKLESEAITNEYGFCVVDGHKQKIANFRVEPPGLFRGRGQHPKMGKLKKRIRAEDIIINIGKKAQVPKPPKGKWKEVRHDNTVSWLASWTENIMGNVKYVMLNPSSKAKSMKDYQKYEKARELKQHVDLIRKNYTEDFSAREMSIRQRAVALYFIDRLALRAGNEKDEEQADTVGCCSLRLEHLKLSVEYQDDDMNSSQQSIIDNNNSINGDSPLKKVKTEANETNNDQESPTKDGKSSPSKGKRYMVEFDFLGKDSIRYQNKVAVEKKVYKNLILFMENKSPQDDLFDRLTTSSLNKYLNECMEGLTAKVFRTYNASKTLQDELDKRTDPKMTMEEKMLAYNRANRAVAVLCNHQRAPPKTHDKQMENLETKISDKEKQLKEAKKEFKKAKKEKDDKNKEKFKKKVATLENQLHKLEIQRKDKSENKTIALGTSKLNYLDPRITVAWCKRYDVPIEKVYNKTQREKFLWAIEMATLDYRF